MFGFFTRLGKQSTDPLAGAEAAEACWRTLPQDDPIAAQMALCALLAESVGRSAPDMERVRALLALDQRARGLLETLLGSHLSGNPPAPSQVLQRWQAAFELCRAFGRVHGQFLKALAENPKLQGGNEYIPYVALHFFLHRQTELLLRPFIDEKSTRFPWKDLHDAYKFSQSRELARHSLPANRRNLANAVDTTLEREYIHVLLQDLMNGGHLSPHEALWVSEAIPRWSEAVALKARSDPLAEHGFVVDLDGDVGIARFSRESAGTHLHLDSTPLLKAMRDEFVTLRDAPNGPGDGSSPGYSQRRRILAKLNVLCANERPVIVRRGERKPTAQTVNVVVGLPQILHQLRSETQDAVVMALRAAAVGENVTITAHGALSEPTGVHVSTAMQGSASAVDASHPPLTMVDRSDSGCRLHGPTLSSNPIVPGALIALREEAASPWALAIVRRVKKRLAGKRVEIGVEFLGPDPRRVVVVGPEGEAHSGGAPPRFAALYLSGSSKYPVLPMKTLILPARGLAPDDRLSVRSSTDLYTIRLKEPLDEQAEFMWSPFAILEHRQTGAA